MGGKRKWPAVEQIEDARVALPAELRRAGKKLDLVAESTPYLWKRRYQDTKDPHEWGAQSLEHFVADQVEHARQVWHVTKNWGWFVLNLGDTRANTGGAGGDAKTAGQQVYRPGDIHLEGSQAIGVPWRCALAIQERTRWQLRGYVVWDKGRPVRTDNSSYHLVRNGRPGNQHETLFMFVKPGHPDKRPYWDPEYLESVKERGDVWRIPASTERPPWAQPSDDTPCWPDELVRRLVLTLTPEGGRVGDFVAGYGTTARVANEHGRVGVAYDAFTYHGFGRVPVAPAIPPEWVYPDDPPD